MKTTSSYLQAKEYVEKVGPETAKTSNHYLTAQRHCTCGACFCCFVKQIVDESLIKPRN